MTKSESFRIRVTQRMRASINAIAEKRGTTATAVILGAVSQYMRGQRRQAKLTPEQRSKLTDAALWDKSDHKAAGVDCDNPPVTDAEWAEAFDRMRMHLELTTH